MGGTGMTTRSRATSMSSGPAISRMNGTIASATIEPSSGTSARLYMGRPLSRLRAARDVHRRALGANDQDWSRRAAQHLLGHAAQHQSPQAAASVGGHDDQARLLRGRGLDDRRGSRAIPHMLLDPAHPLFGET